MSDKEKLDMCLNTLKMISRIIDNITYECRSSVYELTDDEISFMFFCRDEADKTIYEVEVVNKPPVL